MAALLISCGEREEALKILQESSAYENELPAVFLLFLYEDHFDKHADIIIKTLMILDEQEDNSRNLKFYIGALLISKNQIHEGLEWFKKFENPIDD